MSSVGPPHTAADGRTLAVTYDTETGKASGVSTSTTSWSLEYGETSGQLESVSRSDGLGAHSLTYGYDGGFLVSETWASASLVAGSVTQPLDDDFRIERLVVNGASIASFSYDGDGLLVSTGPLTITRSAVSGAVSETTMGDVATAYEYNGFGELELFTASFDATLYYSEAIAVRDESGRILERTATVLDGSSIVSTDHEYGYDAAGRLTQVFVEGNQVGEYVYSESGSAVNGNRIQHVTALGTVRGRYDSHDRLTRYCPEDGAGDASPISGLPCFGYTYRLSGELLTKTDLATSAVTSYDYDELGALRAVTLPDDTAIIYAVDAAGRRVGKRVNGSVQRRWLYKDALEPVAELDSSNTVVSRFVYGTQAHVPDYMLKGGSTYRYVTDHLGSVVMVVEVATGVVAQQMSYDEFGNVLADSNPGFQPFGFAGGLYDADTGLTRFGARDYDPMVGRWTAKDPILFGGGDTNLYAYVGNDPVNFIDPSGLVVDTAWDAASVGYGAYSLTSNLLCGNYEDAAWDALGLALDVGALLLPFVPAVGAAIVKGARHSDDAAALVKLAKEAKQTGVSPEDANTLLKWADEYGVTPAHNHIGTDHWVGGDHIRIGPVNHIPVK